jgi:hypothetical protein
MELTKEEKRHNHELAAKRIFIEHVIGRLKRFKVISERYRNRRRRFGLRFNLIAGIYNYEVWGLCKRSIANRRIVAKERVGARWKVTREKVAKTPYQRVLERPDVSGEVKAKLREEHARLDPAQMRDKIDQLTKRVHDTQSKYGNPRKSPRKL